MAGQSQSILDVLVPMLSGGVDEFGRDVVPPLPLSFDRVNEGRHLTSSGPLFRLPFELLGTIVEYMTPQSLSSLALVSRDCRQLARSAQFASIHLDYSKNSLALIKLLLKEGAERAANNGHTLSPSLGPCIRRITVATHPGWVSFHHQVTLDAKFMSLPKEVKDQRLAVAYTSFFEVYIESLSAVLDKAILPHLELLDWEDRIVLSQSLFNTLGRSSIKHLKLFRVKVDEEFEMKLPDDLVKDGWPLRTLHLEVHWNIFNEAKSEGSLSPLIHSILRLCAQNLEEFTWHSCLQLSIPDTAAWDLPPFIRLRRLNLGQIGFSEPSVLNALVQGNLIALAADTEHGTVYKQFFQGRGKISSLRIFVWDSFEISDTPSLDFLRANTQLSKLSVTYSASAKVLDLQLLPLLTTSFSNLTSLRLAWKETSISDSALEAIGTLICLEQIHLSAGQLIGWKNEWLISHNLVRKHLRKLQRLRKIALSRDTYKTKFESFPDEYYESSISRSTGHRIYQEAWEKQHRNFVLKQAYRYCREIPNLEWIYLGQIPMGITQKANGKRKPVVLSRERDTCWTLLKNMFEWDEAIRST